MGISRWKEINLEPAYSSGRLYSRDIPKIPVRRTSGSGAGMSLVSACGESGGAGKLSHFIEYTSLPSSVRPMGAHLSARTATPFGTSFVCAQAGDEIIKTTTNISLFMRHFHARSIPAWPIIHPCSVIRIEAARPQNV